jgi:hypothetical protein
MGSAVTTTGLNPASFAASLLKALNIPVTNQRVADITAWETAEGQWGATGEFNAQTMHDPLNTKLMKYGGTPIGGGATNTYPSWQAGIAATRDTLEQSNMAPILNALKSGGNPNDFNNALHVAPWAQSLYGGRPIATAVKNPNSNWSSSSTIDALAKDGGLGLVGKALSSGSGIVSNTVSGVDAIGNFTTSLGKWSTWKRVIEVVGGVVLIGAGLVLLTKETGVKTPSVVGSAANIAASAIPGVAEVSAAARGAKPTEKIHIAGGVESTIKTNRSGTKQSAVHKPITWYGKQDTSGDNDE